MVFIIGEDMKTCTKCHIEKPEEAFPKNKKARDGRGSWCRQCASILIARWAKLHPENRRLSTQRWQKANPEKVKHTTAEYREKNRKSLRAKYTIWARNHPDVRRADWLRFNYGITIDEYRAMLAIQNGRCAICKTDKPGSFKNKYFHVDHDHKTGEIRGLLCLKCNTAIWMMNDDPELLLAAVDYLYKRVTFREKAG
jgi:hypothetical protein